MRWESECTLKRSSPSQLGLKEIARVSLVAGALMLVSCGDAGSDEPTLSPDFDVPEDAQPQKPAEQFYLGDKLNFNAFEVQPASVQKLQSVGVLNERPAEGGVFVAVEFKLKNTGNEPLGAFDLPSFKLVDDKGVSYSPDVNASMQHSIAEEYDGKSASDLNPGITTRDGLVWEIAADRFDESSWKLVLEGHENTPINLKPRPNGTSTEN